MLMLKTEKLDVLITQKQSVVDGYSLKKKINNKPSIHLFSNPLILLRVVKLNKPEIEKFLVLGPVQLSLHGTCCF